MRNAEKQIVVLTGPVAAGKTSLANHLVANYGFSRLGTRELILARLPDTPLTRRDLQAAGDGLDLETRGSWVAEGLVDFIESNRYGRPVVIDSLRRQEQISAVRRAVAVPVFHVHVTAPFEVRKARYEHEFIGPGEFSRYEDVGQNSTEAEVDQLANVADLVIDSARIGVLEAGERVMNRSGPSR